MPYDKTFYEGQADGSQRSAEIVVPLLMKMVDVRSVVDIGCGVGTWLKAFRTNGVDDTLGIDGDYVDRSDLRIPAERFRPADLRKAIDLGRRFDLACSLEVAEHLPPSVADQFVATLVHAAPVVLFSAAAPGQGGMNHINEQWQSYWVERFAAHGYRVFDCIRPLIHGNDNVEWWYQQNILLFCAPEAAPSHLQPAKSYEIDRAHHQLVEGLMTAPHSGKEAITAIRRGLTILLRKLVTRLAPGSRAVAR